MNKLKERGFEIKREIATEGVFEMPRVIGSQTGLSRHRGNDISVCV
jgi:hypothetical protein